MPDTRGMIRKISDGGADGLFVSLPQHDGYFRVPADAAHADMRARIEAAKDAGREIAFSYDDELVITNLNDA